MQVNNSQFNSQQIEEQQVSLPQPQQQINLPQPQQQINLPQPQQQVNLPQPQQQVNHTQKFQQIYPHNIPQEIWNNILGHFIIENITEKDVLVLFKVCKVFRNFALDFFIAENTKYICGLNQSMQTTTVPEEYKKQGFPVQCWFLLTKCKEENGVEIAKRKDIVLLVKDDVVMSKEHLRLVEQIFVFFNKSLQEFDQLEATRNYYNL